MNRLRNIFIIAEGGVNHNGSIEIAKKLVDAAKKAGSDAIKFQTFRTEALVSKNAEKAPYQKKATRPEECQYEMLKRLELGEEHHRVLIDRCNKEKISFLSSPFDEKSADLLDNLGVSAFKVPSGEITNHSFLTYLAKKNKPVILSTGMSTLGEVEEALEAIYATGNRQVTLLHCVTEYPAPFEEINLKAILTMKQAFQVPVGYSDHTTGIEIAIAAAALGAEIIEKHITLDRNLDGPDHKASLEPWEFKAMVKAIRNVEKAMGDGMKRPATCELKNISIARRSLAASERLEVGAVLTLGRIALKRPGTGISPKDLNKVLGMSVKKALEPNELITWEKIR